MQLKNAALYLLSLSLLALAGAITYFAASLRDINSSLPQIIDTVEKVNQNIAPLVAEAADIKKQIPAILKESEQIRVSINETIKEAEKLNSQLPVALTESKNWRILVPIIVKEAELARETLNSGIQEINLVRQEIPVSITRVESLITESRNIGKETSEGAVAGVFSGALRAPFELIAGIGNSVFSIFKSEEIILDNSDKEMILETVQALINASEFGKTTAWKNPATTRSGEITLVNATTIKKARCFNFLFKFNDQKPHSENVSTILCETEQGSLEVVR
ncbi:hypothetical protein FLL45_11595 [Aliikangiella marina]|uniref:Surface antigen domain-containing protein n=1 Tax=Aliikangiella marina TaxID=1712262 RepID=A0A545TEA2_9GAMM|nr:hypothetical protein [Aliikangiella marina]TQV75552.1 hypothetical protein FLL45_11595 [Aliikangiella marina]